MKENYQASKTVGLAFKKRNEPDTQARINAAHASVASSFGVTKMNDAQCLALDYLNDSIACCHMAVALSLGQSTNSDDEDDENDEDFDFFPSDDLACSYPQVMKTDHVEMPPDYYPTGIP